MYAFFPSRYSKASALSLFLVLVLVSRAWLGFIVLVFLILGFFLIFCFVVDSNYLFMVVI